MIMMAITHKRNITVVWRAPQSGEKMTKPNSQRAAAVLEVA